MINSQIVNYFPNNPTINLVVIDDFSIHVIGLLLATWKVWGKKRTKIKIEELSNNLNTNNDETSTDLESDNENTVSKKILLND